MKKLSPLSSTLLTVGLFLSSGSAVFAIPGPSPAPGSTKVTCNYTQAVDTVSQKSKCTKKSTNLYQGTCFETCTFKQATAVASPSCAAGLQCPASTNIAPQLSLSPLPPDNKPVVAGTQFECDNQLIAKCAAAVRKNCDLFAAKNKPSPKYNVACVAK